MSCRCPIEFCNRSGKHVGNRLDRATIVDNATERRLGLGIGVTGQPGAVVNMIGNSVSLPARVEVAAGKDVIGRVISSELVVNQHSQADCLQSAINARLRNCLDSKSAQHRQSQALSAQEEP